MKKHIFSLSLILINLLVWVIAYPHISDQVPIHWSSSGEVDLVCLKNGSDADRDGSACGGIYLDGCDAKSGPRKKTIACFLRRMIFSSTP
ncbi:DUF1648 domain-containing protein [Bacillus sonorensis]|nr:DUF1648 domain-containing protein [Bacillus sonorensis]